MKSNTKDQVEGTFNHVKGKLKKKLLVVAAVALIVFITGSVALAAGTDSRLSEPRLTFTRDPADQRAVRIPNFLRSGLKGENHGFRNDYRFDVSESINPAGRFPDRLLHPMV